MDGNENPQAWTPRGSDRNAAKRKQLVCEHQVTAHPFRLSSPKFEKIDRHLRPPTPALSRSERQAIAAAIRARGDEYIDTGREKAKAIGERIHLEADRFCDCGHRYSLWQCDTDNVTFRTPQSCNSRICERCGRRYFDSYRTALYRELAPLFASPRKGWGVFMLTLTTSSKRYGDRLPERKDIERFYKETGDFFRLNYGKHFARVTAKGKIIEDARRHEWKRDDNGERVRRRRTPRERTNKAGKVVKDWRRFKGCGYIATIELGTSRIKSGHLNNNLHCHAIIYAPYISQAELSRRWYDITKDSAIVDIRKIDSPKAATNYVLKYITKPPALRDPEGLAEYVDMIKGTRRLRTGGIFFDRIHKTERERLPFECPYCRGHLFSLGDLTAEDIDSHHSVSLYAVRREQQKAPPPKRLPAWEQAIYAKAAAWELETFNCTAVQ